MPQSLDVHVLDTLRSEFHRLRALGDRALAQVAGDAAFHARIDAGESNSLAIVIRHVAGNMRSRWTDFLTSDGEKPERDRDGEFDLDRRETREELLERWREGWDVTLRAIDALTPADLPATVMIRREPLTVYEALVRQLAHYAEHTGQIILLAKHAAGSAWQTLSIPRGKSLAGQYSYRDYGQKKP
jgi:hypothetical protein